MPDPHFIAIPGTYLPAVAPEDSFDSVYGLELVDSDGADDELRARVRVREELLGPSGALHGGVIAAVAESLASRGTWIGIADPTRAVMGLSNETSHLAPLRVGYLNAVAIPRHKGAAQWLWEVQSRDDDGGLCALSIINIAVRALPRVREGRR